MTSLSPKTLKAAIILDKLIIKDWQQKALECCSDLLDIKLILDCQNTKVKRDFKKHFLYYVINYFCLRSLLTKATKFNDSQIEQVSFYSTYTKQWQHLPEDLINEINLRKFDIIIKFGMNLLIVPKNLEAKYGIVSYHHGDPTKYRGRPAGFYEVLNNEDSVGVIVQRLSNKLDGGDIYSKAFSKIWNWSYKKVAINFYKNSIPLLRKAIVNAQNNMLEPNSAQGKNYTLPTNLQAIHFITSLFIRKLNRLIYGIFVEKKWNVLICHNRKELTENTNAKTLSINDGIVPTIDVSYSFYADPFFSIDGSEVYVEALNKKNGLGEIVALSKYNGKIEKVILKGGHYSYPQPVLSESKEPLLLPEMSNFNMPHFVKFGSDYRPIFEPILGLERYRLVDATYFFHDKLHFIFGSKSIDSTDNLLLFVGRSTLGPYVEHIMNPIVIDPSCARMAGSILKSEDRLFRLGQDNSYGYGSKVWVCEICKLGEANYVEKKYCQIAFDGVDVMGPHTINFSGQSMVLDFYTDSFSFLSGYRRLLKVLRKK